MDVGQNCPPPLQIGLNTYCKVILRHIFKDAQLHLIIFDEKIRETKIDKRRQNETEKTKNIDARMKYRLVEGIFVGANDTQKNSGQNILTL